MCLCKCTKMYFRLDEHIASTVKIVDRRRSHPLPNITTHTHTAAGITLHTSKIDVDHPFLALVVTLTLTITLFAQGMHICLASSPKVIELFQSRDLKYCVPYSIYFAEIDYRTCANRAYNQLNLWYKQCDNIMKACLTTL